MEMLPHGSGSDDSGKEDREDREPLSSGCEAIGATGAGDGDEDGVFGEIQSTEGVIEEAEGSGKSERGLSDEVVISKLKSLVMLLRRYRDIKLQALSEVEEANDADKAPVIDLTAEEEEKCGSQPIAGPNVAPFPSNPDENVQQETFESKKRKAVEEEEVSSESMLENMVDARHMQDLLVSFLSGCFSLRNVAPILHVNAVLSVPAIKTLLLSQKLLLRPFHFNIPRVNFHQLRGYKEIIEGSLCFSELIFLMILVNLPSIQSFDLVQEMLCTHLNFCVYLDTSRSMYSCPTGHITCSFFWSTRGNI